MHSKYCNDDDTIILINIQIAIISSEEKNNLNTITKYQKHYCFAAKTNIKLLKLIYQNFLYNADNRMHKVSSKSIKLFFLWGKSFFFNCHYKFMKIS